MIKKIIKKSKKLPKRFMAFTMILAMLFSYFTPITKVFALSNTTSLSVSFRDDNASYGKVAYSLDDGANWVYITQNVNLNITVTGDNLRLKIVPNENYTVDYAGIEMRQDEKQVDSLSTIGFESANGYVVPSNVQDVILDKIEFRFNGGQGDNQPGDDDTSNHHGNGVSTLNYSINGVIEYTSGGGYDHGITFRINGIPYKADESKMQYTEDTAYERDEQGQIIIGDNNQPIPVLDSETHQPLTEKTGLTITGDTINYDYDTNTNKVNFTFAMAPGTLITGLVINGRTITNLPKTSAELQAHYMDHRSEIEVNDIDKADIYDIEITARYPNASEEYMGNFLWDYNPQGYTSPDDKILNGTLVFVKAEYDGHVYTTPDAVNALGGVYIWHDAPRKDTYTSEREGCGEAQFPKGTMLTVKIVPDAGYQLVDFGVNGGVFAPQEEIGIYSFKVNGGPFHLQATIQKVDDEVQTNSENVKSGNIDLNEKFENGTAKLKVNDVASLAPNRMEGFENTATKEGYKLENYLDISLYNSIYKGGKKDSKGNYESWDTPIENIDNKATISLELEDDMKGKDLAIVHETHNGNEITGYVLIDATYNEVNNTITFETDGFSNYAIVSKDLTDNTKYTVTDNNGNAITFTNEKDREFIFTITDVLSFTDEQLEEAEISKEMYNQVLEAIKNVTKDHGKLLAFYEIEVINDDGFQVHESQSKFNIKIKMTSEMKKYNTFKIINVDIDDEGNISTEPPINLKVEGDYLVGTLEHLSNYALTGSYVAPSNNPQTGDNIYMWIGMLLISVLGLSVGTIAVTKIKKSKVK